MPKDINAGIYRIVDANINRAKEGLRVCEEVTRFIFRSPKLTSDFKNLRHEIDGAIKKIPRAREFIFGRDSRRDAGRRLAHKEEMSRRNSRDIFSANIQRVKESLRVLEEFTKLISSAVAMEFKELRYGVYELEKKAAGKFRPLCNHR